MESWDMRALAIATSLSVFLAATTGCSLARPDVAARSPSIEIDGARFEISDVAVYSNCLNLAFAVSAFLLPAGADPQAFFPPAATIAIKVVTPDGELAAHALGGGGGGGGDEDDGRIWMEQRALFSLEQPVPEGTDVALEITVILDKDFGQSQPLQYVIPVVSGPGGGSCR
jgi:hypothetical protein